MATESTTDYVADTGSIEAILILLVFLIAFALILGEIVDRVLAAWGGAVGMLLVGTYYNSLTWCTGGGHGGKGRYAKIICSKLSISMLLGYYLE